MNRLTVAYNDATRMILRIPRCMSASQICAELRVPACHAVCRNLMFKFIIRLNRSENSIISYLVCPAKSDIRYRSQNWAHWCKLLYVSHENG